MTELEQAERGIICLESGLKTLVARGRPSLCLIIPARLVSVRIPKYFLLTVSLIFIYIHKSDVPPS